MVSNIAVDLDRLKIIIIKIKNMNQDVSKIFIFS